MSDYNKVVENKDGLTKEEFMEVINRTVSDDGCNIFLNMGNENGFPIPVKVTSAHSAFGCLYIDVPELKPKQR